MDKWFVKCRQKKYNGLKKNYVLLGFVENWILLDLRSVLRGILRKKAQRSMYSYNNFQNLLHFFLLFSHFLLNEIIVIKIQRQLLPPIGRLTLFRCFFKYRLWIINFFNIFFIKIKKNCSVNNYIWKLLFSFSSIHQTKVLETFILLALG